MKSIDDNARLANVLAGKTMMKLSSPSVLSTAAVLLGSFALTFGLTYLPCYSAICVEKHFPLNVRIHIGAFYGFLLAGLCIHIAYRRTRAIKTILDSRISSKPFPYTSTFVTWGTFSTVLTTVAFVAACQGYFWGDQKQFYRQRALTEASTTLGTTRLAIVGTTGHMCDFLLGLIVFPVSRDSILRTSLEFDVGTLLWYHKFIGYFLFFVVCIHTVVFYSWVPVFSKAELPLKNVFGIDNPTMRQHEVEENLWYATVLASGMVAIVIFIAIIITSVPKRIRQNYNTFYYTHLLSILFFILASIHASTDFYLLLPGLIFWLIDWLNRIRGLRYSMDARLQKEDSGWYRLVVSRANLPSRLKNGLERDSLWPLKHFYLNIPGISKWQNHPYTTSSATGSQDIVWLFRVSNLGKKEKSQRKEWTVKLAKLIDETVATPDIELGSVGQNGDLQSVTIKLRLSPPYSIPFNPFASFENILCIVGGTGITGALSLANTFLQLRSSSPSQQCVTRCLRLVWSIRHGEDADLVDVQSVLQHAQTTSAPLTLTRFLTGPGRGRLNFNRTLTDGSETSKTGRTWVYLSGPNAFMDAGESACVLRKQVDTDLEWHCARWDV